MLFVVPGGPGEPFLDWRMFLYGIIPMILSVVLIATAGWLWSRAGGPHSMGTYIKRAFQGAVSAILLFWIGLIVAAHLQGRIP